MRFRQTVFKFATEQELADFLAEVKDHPDLVQGEIEITPSLALWMLEYNTGGPGDVGNRHANKKDIEKFSRDMRANAWTFDGDPLKFDRQGRLIDGQKRLMAAAQSGKSFRTCICFNSNWLNVNTGQSESGQSKCRDHKYANHVDAINKMVFLEKHGHDHVIGRYDFKISPRESRSMARTTPLIDEAAFVAANAVPGVTRHAAYGFAYLKFAEIVSRTRADEFFEAIRDELYGGQGCPIRALVRRLRRDRDKADTSAQKLTLEDKVWLHFRTFRAWMRDEHIGRLQIPTGDPSSLVELRGLLRGLR